MIYTLQLLKGFQTLLLGMQAIEVGLIAASLWVWWRVPTTEEIETYMLSLKDESPVALEQLVDGSPVAKEIVGEYSAAQQFIYGVDEADHE